MSGFVHNHPYEIFIPRGTTRIIVGTLPPPRFSSGSLKERDVDFCYGSCDGMLWPALEKIFHLRFSYDNSANAVRERKEFLVRKKMGICDIVESCRRDKVDASDLGMKSVTLRDIIAQLKLHPTITTLIFTGGNSKNGPEYLFRRHLKEHGLKLTRVNSEVPRKHQFLLGNRLLTTVSLTSPSNAANRAIGASPQYKSKKKKNPAYTTFDFRVEQYSQVLLDGDEIC
ncbi:MAG: uracil-DNA glycosylase family protein [Desulforhopalus sp.]